MGEYGENPDPQEEKYIRYLTEKRVRERGLNPEPQENHPNPKERFGKIRKMLEEK